MIRGHVRPERTMMTRRKKVRRCAHRTKAGTPRAREGEWDAGILGQESATGAAGGIELGDDHQYDG
jgi:hypothetical protein